MTAFNFPGIQLFKMTRAQAECEYKKINKTRAEAGQGDMEWDWFCYKLMSHAYITERKYNNWAPD